MSPEEFQQLVTITGQFYVAIQWSSLSNPSPREQSTRALPWGNTESSAPAGALEQDVMDITSPWKWCQTSAILANSTAISPIPQDSQRQKHLSLSAGREGSSRPLHEWVFQAVPAAHSLVAAHWRQILLVLSRPVSAAQPIPINAPLAKQTSTSSPPTLRDSLSAQGLSVSGYAFHHLLDLHCPGPACLLLSSR